MKVLAFIMLLIPTILVAQDIKPLIIWINPDQDIKTINVKKEPIKIGVKTPVKIKNVIIYVNDIAVHSNRGEIEIQTLSTVVYFQKEINLLEGDNIIKVVAEDIFGNTVEDQRIINVTLPDELETRTDYALLFATDEYDSWPNLANPVNDATTIANILKDSYGFKTELITNPTKREVLEKLHEYSTNSYLDNDQLLIFFAGHGQFDKDFKQGYLVAKNSEMNDKVKLSYLSHSNLREIINNIPTKHTLLAIDACFGGTIDPFISKFSERGATRSYGIATKEEFIKRKLMWQTRKYLTSGGKEYVSDGIPGNHSPFTNRLIEILKENGGTYGIITLSELASWMEWLTPEPRFGHFGDNEPGSDFLFIYKDKE